MNECNLSSICQNSFNSFVLFNDGGDDGDSDGDNDDDDDLTMTTMMMMMMRITLTGKLLWKLNLPQSYSPMHCSRRKDCTAQKTIQPNKGREKYFQG